MSKKKAVKRTPKPDPTHGRKEVTWKDLRPLKKKVAFLAWELKFLKARVKALEGQKK